MNNLYHLNLDFDLDTCLPVDKREEGKKMKCHYTFIPSFLPLFLPLTFISCFSPTSSAPSSPTSPSYLEQASLHPSSLPSLLSYPATNPINQVASRPQGVIACCLAGSCSRQSPCGAPSFPAPSLSLALGRDVMIAARPQAASVLLTQRLGRVYKFTERPLSASYTLSGNDGGASHAGDRR